MVHGNLGNEDSKISEIRETERATPKHTPPFRVGWVARNLIFELGFFAGKLGRSCVAALYQEADIEIPSDYNGVVFIPYGSSGGWKSKLGKELKECGYDIDMNKL